MILIKYAQEEREIESKVSVPMRGFNDFNTLNGYKYAYTEKKFPSPCGVLMILIDTYIHVSADTSRFPSPCGVLMILIWQKKV